VSEPHPKEREAELSALTLATWNLERPVAASRRRVEELRRWMRTVGADVWVLTETHDGIVPEPYYSSVASTGTDRHGEPGERWAAIHSRFPLEPLLPTSDPIRSVAARIAPPESSPFIVYGTVLPWIGSSWRGVPSSGGRAFNAAIDAQAADWASLRSAYPDLDLYVLGDFNQDLAERHYYGSHSNKGRLLQALADVGLVALTSGVNDPVRRDSPDCACIDHICGATSSVWRLVSTTRWPDTARPQKGRLSDHFGIAVHLEQRDAPRV
jgi:endonuclease/exonuclease/phosphatase family metal-dependent hydrolase